MKKDKLDKDIENEYKLDKLSNIDDLSNQINGVLSSLNTPLMDMIPTDNILPTAIRKDLKDYENERIKLLSESEDTLKCIANLYLDDPTMKKKNVKSMIKNDAKILADLRYAIEVAKYNMEACSKKIEMGVDDPFMHTAMKDYLKEIRESTKMAYDIQKKMKEFFKEFKGELNEVNKGDKPEDVYEAEVSKEQPTNSPKTYIINSAELNKMLEEGSVIN